MNAVIKKILSFQSELRITKDEQQLIDTFVKEKRFRDVFLQKLNDLRNHGEFMWPKDNYKEVGRVMIIILNEITKDVEIPTAKNVVILSQTFYCKENNKKVYLQSFIQDHVLFKQKDFWENMLLKSIENEMNDYTMTNKKQKISIRETEEENKMKLSNIVFSQVIPFTDNMVGFNIPKEEIKSVLDFVFSKHQIDINHKELIMDLLNKNESNEVVKTNSGKSNSSKQIETVFDNEEKLISSEKTQKSLEPSPQNKGKLFEEENNNNNKGSI